MNEAGINLIYNEKKINAVVGFNFICGESGHFSGLPENCFDSGDNEYELETLEIKLSETWLNKSSMLEYFENQIIEQLENEFRSN